jgi:excisionase family DNA binding protein
MDKPAFSFDKLLEVILELPQQIANLEHEITALVARIPSHESDSELLTVEDVCRILLIKKATLYSMVSRRLIPSYRLGKRRFFKKQVIVEALTKSGKRSSFTELSDEAASYAIQNSNGKRSKISRHVS